MATETKSTKAVERVVDVLVAINATLYIAFVAVVLVVIVLAASGCATTEITHGSTACGTFDSSDTGLGLVVPTAGQYATYSNACATRRTVEVIAEQREAVVKAAWAAAAKVNAVDPKARGMARTALRHSRATAAVVLGEEGGAK